MSKVLKVFIHLILLLSILTWLLLLVPSLVGVTAVVVKKGMVTNIPMGSVVYVLEKSLNELKADDKILQRGENSAYLYGITSLDTSAGVVTLRRFGRDVRQEVILRKTAKKVVITVPLIGYLVGYLFIALQTTEGRIILGQEALHVFIFFIVAKICSGKENEEVEFTFYRDRKLKVPQKKEKRMVKGKQAKCGEGDEDQFFSQLMFRKGSEDKQGEKKYQKRHINGVHSESDDIKNDTLLKKQMLKGDTEVCKELEEAVRTSDTGGENISVTIEKIVGIDTIPDLQTVLEAELATQQIRQPEQMLKEEFAIEEEKQMQVKKIALAIPVKTVEEFLQEAYSDGNAPVVKEDNTTGVKFVDYSKCL